MTATSTKLDELHNLVLRRQGLRLSDEELWRWLRENNDNVEQAAEAIYHQWHLRQPVGV